MRNTFLPDLPEVDPCNQVILHVWNVSQALNIDVLRSVEICGYQFSRADFDVLTRKILLINRVIKDFYNPEKVKPSIYQTDIPEDLE